MDQYGKKNTLGKNVLFYVPHGKKMASVKVGNEVQIGEHVRIDCLSPIEIKDNVWISENVSIFNHQHVLCGRALKQSKNVKATEGLFIGRDAWIGAGAMVLPQVSYIGEGAVIGAGSVVTKNVEDYKIVAGNPATIIGERD